MATNQAASRDLQSDAVRDTDAPSWRESELIVAETIGRLMEFWGFKRHMGRVWGVLYMSPTPASASELSDALQMSPSALSQTLADLSRWGAINKEWVPGQRREHFSAETSIWKMVRRVFEQRELQLVVETAEAFRLALEKVRAANRMRGSESDKQRLEFMQRRLEQLCAFSEVGERLVRALINGNILDPSWLQSADSKQKSHLEPS